MERKRNRLFPSLILGVIGLGIIVVVSLFSLPKILQYIPIPPYIVIPLKVIGNVTFGISLFGFFLNIKKNFLLKWSSLVLGILYVLNFNILNDLFAYFIETFNIYDLFYLDQGLITTIFYVLFTGLVSVFLVFSLYPLAKTNLLIAGLMIINIFSTGMQLTSNLATVLIVNLLQDTTLVLTNLATVGTILSYLSLLGIFISLLVLQFGELNSLIIVKEKNILQEPEEENPDATL
ncbi:MAG: hypothetical protein LBM99_04290 [Bacillales bacterium]|jgi:hypothetical protein|nr:hypothetical protein [Bacillales bacterium]